MNDLTFAKTFLSFAEISKFKMNSNDIFVNPIYPDFIPPSS